MLIAALPVAPASAAPPAPETPADHLRKAAALQVSGNFDEALKEYAAANVPDALFFSAEIHRLKGEDAKAGELYKAYLAAVPKGSAADAARRFGAAHGGPPVAETPAVATPQISSEDAPQKQPATETPAPPTTVPPAAVTPPGQSVLTNADVINAMARSNRRKELLNAGGGVFAVGLIFLAGGSVAQVFNQQLWADRNADLMANQTTPCIVSYQMANGRHLNQCRGMDGNGNYPIWEDQISDGKWAQISAIIGFSVGGAMSALGLGLMLGSLAYSDTVPQQRAPQRPLARTGIRLKPVVGLSQLGITGEF
jgi:hypothetical protein